MKVVEIFKSIDGEGIRAGFPATFIRLVGCNLRCTYCDTKYSYNEPSYNEMTVQQILDAVIRLGCKRITLTGGEPLIHEDVKSLINILLQNDFEVNIETNGSVPIQSYTDWGEKRVIVTMDYKCPVSGMEDQMLMENLKHLRKTDVLKFVVGSEEDLKVCQNISKFTDAQIFISPVFGMIELSDIVNYMLEHNMDHCRLQVQLHKIVFDPEARGV